MHHPTYRTLKAAYSFYNVSTKTPWVDLMQDALISARDVSYAISNIITIIIILMQFILFRLTLMCSTP